MSSWYALLALGVRRAAVKEPSGVDHGNGLSGLGLGTAVTLLDDFLLDAHFGYVDLLVVVKRCIEYVCRFDVYLVLCENGCRSWLA